MSRKWCAILALAAVHRHTSAVFVDDSASLLQVADLADISADHLLALSPPRPLLTKSYSDLVSDFDDDGAEVVEVDSDGKRIVDSTAGSALENPKRDDQDTVMDDIARVFWPQKSESKLAAPVQTNLITQKVRPRESVDIAPDVDEDTEEGEDNEEEGQQSVPDSDNAENSSKKHQHLHKKREHIQNAEVEAREKKELKHMHRLAIIIVIVFAAVVCLLMIVRSIIKRGPDMSMTSPRKPTLTGASSEKSGGSRKAKAQIGKDSTAKVPVHYAKAG